jgi:hypothetical protein
MAVGLDGRTLVFHFEDVHEDAILAVAFHRTLRLPDDGRAHPLPPSLGHFDLRDVHDLPPDRLPNGWKTRGGVCLPMWQTEAMWLSFSSPNGYPFALKVAAGRINAVNGEPWSEALVHGGAAANYVEVPGQPWLDGFHAAKGEIRQFVAMPLGKGYTAEAQLTGEEVHGGVQLMARPLKAALWEQIQRRQRKVAPLSHAFADFCMPTAAPAQAMGLGAGGRMQQDIYPPEHRAADFETPGSRCFIAIANAEGWQELTGRTPQPMPPAYVDYVKSGGALYDYDAGPGMDAAPILKGLKSVKAIAEAKGEPAPQDASPQPGSEKVILLGPNAKRSVESTF